MTYFLRLVAWIGKLVATGMGGPGITVLGDPGLDALRDSAPAARPHETGWRRRAQVFSYEAAPLGAAILIVLFLTGSPWWPIWLVGLVLVLLPFLWGRRPAR